MRELLNHVNDTERVFLFRALWFARGFSEPLPSYDQEVGVAGARADEFDWANHVEEFRAVRLATLAFFRNLPPENLGLTGNLESHRHRERQSIHSSRAGLHPRRSSRPPHGNSQRALLISMLLICCRLRVFVLALVLCSLITPGLVRAKERTPAQARTVRPRLILLIVADQFRYDYLDRFGDLFGEKGLKRLQREGASWLDANYNHFPTYTAPGHATVLTGAFPSATGIIGNDWPDRDTGMKVSSVSDETVSLLGGSPTEKGVSPRRLLASTLGDELRVTSNDRSKVIGIGLKDRAAVLPVGRYGNAAYWFSWRVGWMVSSDYYFKQLPAWVTRFNSQRPADKYFKAKWEQLLPEQEYQKRAGPDSPAWEDIGKVAATQLVPSHHHRWRVTSWIGVL